MIDSGTGIFAHSVESQRVSVSSFWLVFDLDLKMMAMHFRWQTHFRNCLIPQFRDDLFLTWS